MTEPGPPPGYRACVGVMLFNGAGRVFAGRRSDTKKQAWQMPQGGIDSGEAAAAAALRELAEEAGTDKAQIVARTTDWLTYDFPGGPRRKAWRGRYVGQAQHWFLMRFTGKDSDIDLNVSKKPEFDAWRWMTLDRVVREIVEFKRPVYEHVAGEFEAIIRDAVGSGRKKSRKR